jgi:ribosomal protein S27AE
MPVAFGSKGKPRVPRSVPRCSRCGSTSEVGTLQERPACSCGSNAWTTGPAMGWPPFLLSGQPSPHFLMGDMPRTPAVQLDLADRRPAERVRHGRFLAGEE